MSSFSVKYLVLLLSPGQTDDDAEAGSVGMM